MAEEVIFSGRCILTNCNVWSPDSRWIVFDTRSDPAGSCFDGSHILAVNIETREVRTLYESRNGAHCGVVTFHPLLWQIAFIHGPEFPTSEYQYGPSRRYGAIVNVDHLTDGNAKPLSNTLAIPLDARNMQEPYTAGALRGGSHVHIWNGTGERISYTYEDDIVAGEPRLRTIGVTDLSRSVIVPSSHPRNHDGRFSVVVVNVTADPKPGSDELQRAVEDAWIGVNGYRKPDGTHQRFALAFQGFVVPEIGASAIPEVFVADLPDNLAIADDAPLEGTTTTWPRAPKGVQVRRLTFTANDRFPGIAGPRHWLRSSPDGSQIAFMKRDQEGVVQLYTISPNGGEPQQQTEGQFSMESTCTWHPDGKQIAFIRKSAVCILDSETGSVRVLAAPTNGVARPEACVISPNGHYVAFVQHRDGQNQLSIAKTV